MRSQGGEVTNKNASAKREAKVNKASEAQAQTLSYVSLLRDYFRLVSIKSTFYVALAIACNPTNVSMHVYS